MRPENFRPPVTLEGRFVRLVPLATSHRVALWKAGSDPDVGRYVLHGPGSTLEQMDDLIAYLLDQQTVGTDLAFTTVRVEDNQPVGMTRFLHIDRSNDSVEVGGTWLDRRWWRTPFNTESKYLMLGHAFEVEQAHRVSLQTDLRNVRSQRAIERLGAIREAALREDRLLPDGSYRTSVLYSILAPEWPRVKQGLEQKLARPWRPPA
jgi:RimJ/RimL family protein N-acetyltransferase